MELNTNKNDKRGILLARTSAIDALIWACKLKKKGIIQFEYKELPNELKNLRLVRRAKEEGVIFKVKKNGNRVNIWRIADNIECDED